MVVQECQLGVYLNDTQTSAVGRSATRRRERCRWRPLIGAVVSTGVATTQLSRVVGDVDLLWQAENYLLERITLDAGLRLVGLFALLDRGGHMHIERKQRRTVRSAAVICLAAFACGFGGTAALAGVAWSSPSYSTIGGNQYRNENFINTSTGHASSGSNTRWNVGTTPSGWAGSLARVYTSTGSLKFSSSIVYNSCAGCSAGASTGGSVPGGNYYARGNGYGWNGSGYGIFASLQTPNQTA